MQHFNQHTQGRRTPSPRGIPVPVPVSASPATQVPGVGGGVGVTGIPATGNPTVPVRTNAPSIEKVFKFKFLRVTITRGWWKLSLTVGTVTEGGGSRGGSTSVQVSLTTGSVLPRLVFSPLSTAGFAYIRDALSEVGGEAWRMSYYNRMSFSVFVPRSLGYRASGKDRNMVVILRTRSPTADSSTVGAGGLTFLHRYRVPYTGGWHKVIVDPHPDVITERSLPAGRGDFGSVTNPLQESGLVGHDCYFDYVTQLQVGFETTGTSDRAGAAQQDTAVEWQIEDLLLYRQEHIENEEAVYGLSGSAWKHPTTGGVSLKMTWSRNKDDAATAHEVRYAYTSVHTTGYAAASYIGLVRPVDTLFAMSASDMASQLPPAPLGATSIFVAVRPQGSTTFKEIELPLQMGAYDTPVPSVPLQQQEFVKEGDSSSGMSAATIIAIIIVIVLGICAIIALYVCNRVRRRRRKQERLDKIPDDMSV